MARDQTTERFSGGMMGYRSNQWAVVVLLMIVVLIPSATVLWLADAAVRNERAAIRQRLMQVYRRQLDFAAAKVNRHWAAKQRTLTLLASQYRGAELFQASVREGVADSVLVFDSGGALVYPRQIRRSNVGWTIGFNPIAWQAANRLEYVEANHGVAAEAYAAIAAVEPESDAEATARIAQARCLQKAGRTSEALRVLTQQMNRPAIRDARDAQGRSHWLDAQLRALELMVVNVDESTALQRQRDLVQAALNDYSKSLPSSQRLFGMKRFQALFPKSPAFETLAAETHAAQYMNGIDDTSPSVGFDFNDDPAFVAIKQQSAVLLFRQEALAQEIETLLSDLQSDDISIGLVTDSPDASDEVDSQAIASKPLSSIDGKSLALTLDNPALFDNASRQQTALYTIAGLFTIAIVAVVAIFIALFVRQQLRLAQLKNDLAAVVTHELRTPLASIRVLVDTLIEQGEGDDQRRSEYLNLIAKENERLSRLIENFLVFSRTQRGQQRLDMRQVEPGEIVNRAIESCGRKLDAAECQFTLDVGEDLPSVRADVDAMVTVLLNLLDNAIKFSLPPRVIDLRVYQSGGNVLFEIEDNGLGMTPKETRRVFEKFYQADSRLSRSHGGCGLGLSLVRAIVSAHGGDADVESAVKQGSVFRVRLPAVRIPIINASPEITT